ncbi:serine/threonine-protein kinase bud32 [Cryptotrichosporon argae]
MSAPAYVSPSLRLIEHAGLIKQGAEAKVYVLDSFFAPPTIYSPSASSSSSSSSTPVPPAPPAVVLKHRFPKTYRHPTLDATLTRARLSAEARALARALRAGVSVPHVLWVDEVGGVLGIERVEGWSVREVLGGGAEGEVEDEDEDGDGDEGQEEDGGGGGGEDGREGDGPRVEQQGRAGLDEHASEGAAVLAAAGVTTEHVMRAIGHALALLHAANIIHGDLTTSNMMVRPTPGGREAYEIVLIDFGLSTQATLPEHDAVDLYVLERAFASTHPASEALYAGVLDAYARGLGEKKWRPIEAKLKEVRLRGRKRDMTG